MKYNNPKMNGLSIALDTVKSLTRSGGSRS